MLFCIGNYGGVGGVLSASFSTNISISRVDFVENNGFSVGCLSLAGPGIGTITNSLFSNNAAGIGAISVINGFELSISNSILAGKFISTSLY